MHFTGNADLIFLRNNLYPFWTLAKIIFCNSDETGFLFDCPSLMLGIAIRYIQHSQAMLERGVSMWACSLFLSFTMNGLFDCRHQGGDFPVIRRWRTSTMRCWPWRSLNPPLPDPATPWKRGPANSRRKIPPPQNTVRNQPTQVLHREKQFCTLDIKVQILVLQHSMWNHIFNTAYFTMILSSHLPHVFCTITVLKIISGFVFFSCLVQI